MSSNKEVVNTFRPKLPIPATACYTAIMPVGGKPVAQPAQQKNTGNTGPMRKP